MGRGDIKKQTLLFTFKLNQDQTMDGKFGASCFQMPRQKKISEELFIVSFLLNY